MPATEDHPSVHDRLDRLEKLLLSIEGRLKEESATRSGWRTFWFLVAIHAGVSCFLLAFDDFTDNGVAWGWFAGAAATLATWHGLSLRPALEKWLRTIVAFLVTFAAMLVSYLPEYIDFEDLAQVVLPWCMLFGGGCLLASRGLRHFLGVGLQAPDSKKLEPSRLTLGELGRLATLAALLMASCRLVSLWGQASGSSTDASILLLVAFFGVFSGAALSFLILAIDRWLDRRLPKQIVACGLILLVLTLGNLLSHVALINLGSILATEDFVGLWTLAELRQAMPVLFAFETAFLISPLVTTVTLVLCGHRLCRVSKEAPAVSDTNSPSQESHASGQRSPTPRSDPDPFQL